MKLAALALFLLASVANVAAIGKLCDLARYPWPGQQPTATITTNGQRYRTFSGQLLLSGDIKILNGCFFQMVNLRIENAYKEAGLIWLGALTSTEPVPATVSDQSFWIPGAFGNNSAIIAEGPIFNLTTVAGREVAWYDLKYMTLYSYGDVNNFATVTLPTGNYTQPGIGDPIIAAAPGLPANPSFAPLCGSVCNATNVPSSPQGGVSTGGGTGTGTPTTTGSSTPSPAKTGAASASFKAGSFIAGVGALLVALAGAL
ncbi:hypothetical protein BJ742DRAFT_781873 [Cladochytrium replicatum]|nr:hypothetical protein BJ742DRAFT_781873 [Cladochytrium replicatum]